MPKKIKLKKDIEHQSQCAVVSWAMMSAGKVGELDLLFAIPNGTFSSPNVGARMVAEGAKRGFPDLCLPVPKTSFRILYCALYVEMKAPGGHYRPDQRAWGLKLRAANNAVEVCYSAPEAIEIITTYLAGNYSPRPFPKQKKTKES